MKELENIKKAAVVGTFKIASASGSAAGVGSAEAGGAESVNGVSFIGKVLDEFDPKGLRGLLDDYKKRLGSGVAAAITVNEGRASVAVGVTDDLASKVNAVELVRAAVAALGGQGGGGRPDMAQGGGPNGSKAQDALEAVRTALEKVAA
jgi:alanyl-tRNA synthetase